MAVPGLLSALAAAVTSLFLTLAAFAGPAAAQAYPPPPIGFSISTGVVGPGGSVSFNGSGCPANSPVTVTLQPGSVSLATTVAGPTGSYSGSFTIPVGTAPGSYSVVAACGGVTQSSHLVITGPASARSGGPLPHTGTDVMGMLIGALALVLAGTGVVLAARQRRHSTAH